MKKQTIVLIFVIGTALLTSLLLAGVSFITDAHLIENAKQREMHYVTVMILDELRNQTETAEARVSLIANLPVIQDAFRAKNRQVMIDRLLPAFLIQHHKFNVIDASFYTAPAISFLRLFDLKSQGEDVSAFREIILKTNHQQKPQKGIEIGRFGPSIRAVDIIKDKEGILGSFEIGLDFKRVLRDIKENTGFDVGVFINNRLMNTIATEVPKTDQDHIVGEFQAFDATDWERIRAVITPVLLDNVNDITYKTEQINGQNFGLVIIPLLDFKGVQIGSILAVNDFKAYAIEFKANVIYTLAFALLQIVLLTGVILIAFKTLMAPSMAETTNPNNEPTTSTTGPSSNSTAQSTPSNPELNTNSTKKEDKTEGKL